MLAKRHSKAILGLLPLVLLSLTSCGEPDPPGNGTLSLNVADWVPAFEHEGQWRVVPVGGASEDSVTSTDPNATIELPAGRYDVYWIQGYPQEDAPMLLAGDVRVETGQETTVDANSGIHVDQADWVPTFGHEGWWGAVPTGKALSDRVDWTDDDLDLLLPPGTYDVYWVQDYHHAKAPMLLGRDLLCHCGSGPCHGDVASGGQPHAGVRCDGRWLTRSARGLKPFRVSG